MSRITELEALRARVERAKRGAAKAQGALEHDLKRLKEEFNCDDIESAEELLKSLEEMEKTSRREFEQALAQFEREWASSLDEEYE